MSASMTKPLGRNEPCRCGSGRKYKQCCLEKDEAAERKARAGADEQAPAPSGESEAPRAAPAPRHNTRQPWKGNQNTRGFQNQKVNAPRRSGGS